MTENLSSTKALAPSATEPASSQWPDIKAWRRALRKDLIARRGKLQREERVTFAERIAGGIRHVLPNPEGRTVGFYWPIQSELDLRFLLESLIEQGAQAALPVVVEKQAPVEFWAWRPGMRMQKGFWDIPQPPERAVLTPDVLIVPLVGFDSACYRLGYGGGYYDRTLAAFETKPYCIGIGLELGRLPTIHPQPHDIPMDVIVTETERFSRAP